MSAALKSCQVYDKVPPIFVCEHLEGTETEKFGRNGQKYLATPHLNAELISYLTAGIAFKATAKVDGTSTIVRDGLFLKRRDRKQKWNKKKKQMVLKAMPDDWIRTGIQTDKHGVGYMPLERGDTWFFDVFDRDPDHPESASEDGHPLIDGSPSTRVRVVEIVGTELVYRFVELSDLDGKSFELLGPKIQCNSHGLQYHALMEHGALDCANYPDVSANGGPDLLEEIRDWHRTDPLGSAVEGIVLHFENGKMFKLHRHHLDMEWGHQSNDPVTPLFEIAF
jgi:Family of unknown function (DUF5565)